MEQQQYAQPQFSQPQFVMMPVSQSNGLGVFGFFVALIGLFIPTGIVALLGLVLSLAAIGRAPRGFATFGIILGLLGTVIWLTIMLAVVAVGLVAAVGVAVVSAGMFVVMQPEPFEVTSDMVKVAIAAEEYEREHDEFPEEMGALALTLAATLDPWGGEYQFMRVDNDQGFDVASSGPDREFGTDDDIRLTRLDEMWETAFASFEDNMDEFGQKLERLENLDRYGCDDTGRGIRVRHQHQPPVVVEETIADAYERAAARSIGEDR